MGISEVSVAQSKEWGTAGSQYLAHSTMKMLDMIWSLKKKKKVQMKPVAYRRLHQE